MSFALGLLVGAATIAIASWLLVLSWLERVDAQIRSARRNAAEAANAAGHAHEQASTLRHRFDQRFRDLADDPLSDRVFDPESEPASIEDLFENDPQEVDAA